MADDTLTPFSSAFPDATEADWQGLVEKMLKGKSPDTLNSKTRDGVVIQALYRETDFPASTDPNGLPGTAPFVRGTSARKDAYLPWDIRQVVSHPDVKAAHDELMADLERGVSSVELRIDTTGERGIAVQSVADLDTLLDGVMTDLAGVALTNSALEGFGLEGAALLAAWCESKGKDPAAQKFAFNVDPIAELARSGSLPDTFEAALKETAAFVKDVAPVYTSSTFIRVDARPAHCAGGTEAQELAFAMASGVTYLRALLEAGLTLEAANASLLFTLAVGPEYALETAKLRAARRLWADVTKAFGAEAGLPMKLQAVTSRRMLTKRDPWVNLLRNTAACFAAGVGGADIVTVRPFTDAIGLADKLGRRTARNTQIMAQEESSLGKVADPAAGTWSIGKLSEDLAAKAWEIFQSIEAEGGIGASLQVGSFQAKVADARAMARKDIAKRKQPITGVSEFALIDEEVPKIIDREAFLPNVASDTGAAPASRAFADLAAAAGNGASVTKLLAAESDDHAQADPLFPVRWSEPFEILRDHADAMKAKTGKQPEVFLACLGPIAKHNARASFAANFFAAGGIAANMGNAPYDSLETLGADFKASGAVLCCICGSDDQYAEIGEEAAMELRNSKEDARIYLAGRPGELESTLKTAGVDDFIYVGADLIQKLEIAHSELGLGA